MKNLLAFIGVIVLFSCSKQSRDTTSSGDSTITKQAELSSTALSQKSEYDSRDEEEVNPGDVVKDDDSATDYVSIGSDTSYHGPMDFQPGAAGDPPTPEEEEAQRKIDEAEPIETNSKPLNELYFTSARSNELVTYSLRYQKGKIVGFCFRPQTSRGIPVPIEVSGVIDAAAGTFKFNELAMTKVTNIMEGKIDGTDLVGTRYNEDRSTSAPFKANRVGPRPHNLNYVFMHKVIDNVQTLFTITLTSPKSKYRQELAVSAVVNSQLRAVTMDWNFDGYLDFFLMCKDDSNCDGHFFLYQPEKKKFDHVAAFNSLPNPWIDFGNKRIVSITKQNDGSIKAKDFAYDEQYFIREKK